MILFEEVDQSVIVNHYPSYVHGKARYFKIIKNNRTLCFYGVIAHTQETGEGRPPGEAFLMMKTFQGKVLSREFFEALFAHADSLGYKEIWTWTKWEKLAKLFRHFKRFGIETTGCPPWDNKSKLDPRQTKTWFIKKVKEGS